MNYILCVLDRTLSLPITTTYSMIMSPYLKSTAQAHRASLDTPTSPSVSPNLALRTTGTCIIVAVNVSHNYEKIPA